MSAAHIKLGNWKRALDTAEQALAKNPDNFKALFRKGKALGELGWFEKAEPILQDLLKKNPADTPTINAEIARLRAMDKDREKKASNKMKGGSQIRSR
jgi:tetratricopeptide (TPR) repeat protein